MQNAEVYQMILDIWNHIKALQDHVRDITKTMSQLAEVSDLQTKTIESITNNSTKMITALEALDERINSIIPGSANRSN